MSNAVPQKKTFFQIANKNFIMLFVAYTVICIHDVGHFLGIAQTVQLRDIKLQRLIQIIIFLIADGKNYAVARQINRIASTLKY